MKCAGRCRQGRDTCPAPALCELVPVPPPITSEGGRRVEFEQRAPLPTAVDFPAPIVFPRWAVYLGGFALLLLLSFLAGTSGWLTT